MVAVSQLPSSEIEVSDLPSGVTCRSDQPPKLAELAVIEMPPRQRSLPTRRCAGSSSFSTSGWERMSRGTGWAPTGDGGGAPAQAAATRRQKPSRGRIAARIVRDPLPQRACQRRCNKRGLLPAPRPTGIFRPADTAGWNLGGALAAGLGGGGAAGAAGATPGL